MTPTTIAIFVKNLTSGGAEKQAVLLAKALSRDYDVHFIVFNAAKTHQKYIEMIHETPEIHLTLFNGGHVSRFHQFCSYIKKTHIELIFSYLTAANLYACLAGSMTGAKVVTGLRNAELPFGKQIVDRFLTNHLAILTIANCYSGKENFIKQGFREKKVHVIPNCFSDIIPYCHKDGSDTSTIITVGRFVEQKDYLTAIKSVAKVNTKFRNIRFCIIGFGELEQQIRAWVREEGISDITDILINPDNISQYLEKADIYLSTSLFEGTSNSIMEGMNANLPIVATNVGDNSYLVKDGENGFLAEKRDVDTLAHHLETLITNKNLRQLFGEKSKEILYDNYSLDTFRDKYIQTIKEL
jgi:glycosyltransferase involved in cell wall biosynthesis